MKKLDEIKNWFNFQNVFNFYSSSILIAYDFDIENNNTNDDDDDDDDDSVRINMIDFTHVIIKPKSSENDIDQNYVFGLNSLITYIKRILGSQ